MVIRSLTLAIDASLKSKPQKRAPLEQLRIEIEKVKHIIRVVYEVKVIKSEGYLELQTPLQEISKMATGWIKYLETKKEPNNGSLW